MVDLAWKNLVHDKLRFGITVSGVGFSVALVLVQMGLFLGLLGNATRAIEKIPAELWVVAHNAQTIDFAQRFPDHYVNRVRATPGVQRADNLLVVASEIHLPSGAREGVSIYALEDFKAWSFPWNILQGDIEDLRRGPNLFIDASADHRFRMPMTVGQMRELRHQRVRIIGRTQGARSFTTTPLAFMDLERAHEQAPYTKGLTSFVLVKLSPGASLEEVQRELQARLPHNDVLRSEDWARRSSGFWVKRTGLGLNMFVTVLLGCLVGTVIVSQTLYTLTTEHLKEFGVLRAMGGTTSQLFGVLARQALISAVLGFALGLGPSFAIRPLIANAGLDLPSPPWLVASVFVGTLVLCLVASLVPGRKVLSIDPAQVFR